MLKRVFDLILSAAGLIALSPFILAVAWRIRREDGGPVFYRGVRVGRFGRPFRIYKFRSMVMNADKIGPDSTAEDDPRVTKIGRFIRKNKIDEIPQLINVFLGDMSLVGPRPQVQWAVDLYTEEEREILSARPGMTDPASLKFSNEDEILKNSKDPDGDYLKLIHPEKTALALAYVREQSLWLDIKIILATVSKVWGKA